LTAKIKDSICDQELLAVEKSNVFFIIFGLESGFRNCGHAASFTTDQLEQTWIPPEA